MHAPYKHTAARGEDEGRAEGEEGSVSGQSDARCASGLSTDFMPP